MGLVRLRLFDLFRGSFAFEYKVLNDTSLIKERVCDALHGPFIVSEEEGVISFRRDWRWVTWNLDPFNYVNSGSIAIDTLPTVVVRLNFVVVLLGLILLAIIISLLISASGTEFWTPFLAMLLLIGVTITGMMIGLFIRLSHVISKDINTE